MFAPLAEVAAAFPWFFPTFAFAIGACVGSFLNVVILRLPPRLMHTWRQQSRELLELPIDVSEPAPAGIVWEPSHCPQCRHKLGALENIPLLSWLRWRCPTFCV